MTRIVKKDNIDIQYEIQRKKVKNLNLRVTSEGEVKVSVPYGVSYAYADKFVLHNADFVIKAKEKAKIKSTASIEHIKFLGERLKITPVFGCRYRPEIVDGELILPIFEEENTCFDRSDTLIQAALDNWKKEKGREIFPDVLLKGYDRFCDCGLQVPFPSLTVRNMKTRWGSCTAGKGKICLNAALVEKPLICIEYVVCHELAHFLVHNHSADFYEVLNKVFPEHREIKKMLNTLTG